MWSGGYNQEHAADQYLWDIEANTFEYVPISVTEPRCFFDGGVDDTYWVECSSGDVQDCVDYCETSCWSQGKFCAENNPCFKLSETDLECKEEEGTPDIFCAGHTNWIDGSPLVQGGNVTGALAGGAPNSLFRFPSDLDVWEFLGRTETRRWYPTLTTLHDGRVTLLGGELSVASKSLTLIDGAQELNVTTNPWGTDGYITYPFMFQMTDGRLFFAGNESPLNTILFDGQVFNPDTLMYEETYGSSTIPGGSAVMYAPDRVMKSGGCLSSSNRCEAYQETEVIDLLAPAPDWKTSCPMPQPRHFHTLTSLPDGTVLMTGGNTEGNGTETAYCRSPNGTFTTNECGSDAECEMSVFGNETCEPYDNTYYATRSAVLWWPWGGQWIEFGEQVHARMYHSTAILLPDGRVLSAGSGQRQGIPSETEVEFFSPPYKFWGPEPVIEYAPSSAVLGSTVEVEVSFDGESSPANRVHRVTMLRLGSVTHQFDQDQRFIELDFEVSGNNTLDVEMPADGAQMIPGWTMLFVLTDRDVPPKFTNMASVTGAPAPGVPSKGHYLRLDLDL